MVDAIVRLTVLAVLALAAANALHGGAVLARLVRHLARHRNLELLWFPAFSSMTDVRAWLHTWRGVLGSGDPALVAIRTDARLVVGRHLYLAILSNTWAMALTAIAPHIA